MNKMNLLITALCLPLICNNNLNAQQRLLSMKEMFLLAEQSSKSILAHQIGIDESESGVKSARADRLPDIAASLSFSYLGNGYITDRNFSNGQSIYIPHYGNNFALTVSQAVFTGGAVTSNIRLADLSHQMAELNKDKDVQRIRYLLTGYYLDLYKLGNQSEVLKSNIALTEKLIENIRQRHDQGTALKNDITRYELQMSNLKLQQENVNNSRAIINHQLVTVLGLDSSTEIVPDTSIVNESQALLSEKEWQEHAVQNSIDLKRAETNISIRTQKVKLERSEMLPKIALIAEAHLDGPVTIEIPALNNNFNYWFVGVGVKYSLSSLFKNNNRLRSSKLALNRSRTEKELTAQQTDNAVQAAYVRLNEAHSNLQTQEKSLQLALQNYEVIDKRYHNDLALLTDMLDASNSRLNAELDLVNARINLTYCYFTLKYACGEL